MFDFIDKNEVDRFVLDVRLEAEAQRMVADRRYRYISFEDRINQAGYDLLNGGKTEQALSVFQLNARLFPQSANAWDSLGEANYKAGQTETAVEFYEKAIALDPDGDTGENARRMLKEITGAKR